MCHPLLFPFSLLFLSNYLIYVTIFQSVNASNIFSPSLLSPHKSFILVGEIVRSPVFLIFFFNSFLLASLTVRHAHTDQYSANIQSSIPFHWTHLQMSGVISLSLSLSLPSFLFCGSMLANCSHFNLLYSYLYPPNSGDS